MFRSIPVLLLSGVLLCPAQAQYSNFPPGTFTVRGSAGSATGFSGLGDAVAQSAYAYWGIRAYNAAYGTGNAAILCDSATFLTCSTINYLSTGYIDTTTAAGSAACAVACVAKQIYDSTGNGHHATCANAAACATFTFNCHGTYPCYKTTGAQTYTLATAASLAYPNTVSLAILVPSHGNVFGGICCGTTYGVYYGNTSNNMQLFNGGSAQNFTATDAQWNSVQGIANGASSIAYVNGSSTSLSTPGTSADTIANLFNVNGSNTTMSLLEAAIYNNVAFSGTDQTNAWNNQHAAYGGL